MSGAMLAGVAGLSLLASSVAGLLGAGGDILFVPLLLYALPALGLGTLDLHTIGALSLVLSIASTGSGGLVHYLDRRVDSASFRAAAPPLVVGALVGGLLSGVAANRLLLVLFAVVTSGVVVLLMVPVRAQPLATPPPSRKVTSAMLAATALVCSMVGVGGGFLIVTILRYRGRLSMQLAKGTALSLTVCTAVPGLTGKVVTGQLSAWVAVPVVVAAAVTGGVVGSKISGPLSEQTLRLGLALLVVVLTVRMWVGILGLHGL